MMSTIKPNTVAHNHSLKSVAIQESKARKSTAKFGQDWSLSKLGFEKRDGDSGIGSSDSSDSMCNVKDSFQETIMNLKALNGDGANTEIKETTDSAKVSSENHNGKDSLKMCDKANGDKMSSCDSVTKDSKHDNEHNGIGKRTDEAKLEESNSVSRAETLATESTKEPSTSPSEDEPRDDMEENSENISETQKGEEPEEPIENPSEMQSEAEPVSEEASRDSTSQASGPAVVATTEDKIEIIDSDNEESNAADDEIMIVSGKDEKSNDSESSDHPLTIGDKVKKSVRDIMSKLKQGISPELNKLLVKPKHEETMDTETTETVTERKAAEKTKSLPQSPRKGNLFENLTVIGAGGRDRVKTEVKNGDERDEQKNTKNSGSQSDVELIEDSDFDKKEDEVILFEEKPLTKNNSGKSSATQDIKDIKLESDSTPSASPPVSSDRDIKPKEKVKKEVKTEVKSEKTCSEKPMEIDVDEDEMKEVKDVKPLIKVTPPSDQNEDSSEASAMTRNERKRSQDSQSGDGGPPKRSRLDMVIGKLGSQIGISPEMIKTDSSDEDSRQCSDTSEKSEDNLSSVSDEDDDKTSQSSTKTIRLSGKELEALVRSKVSAYLKVYRDNKMEILKTKVEELQATNETWKSHAKELQKQVLDLTVLQQRLEKRKAATAALRQITTRSVGIQADETKLNMASSQPGKVAKTPPKASAPATSITFTTPIPSSINTTTGTTSSTSLSGVVMTTTQALTSSAVTRNSVSQLLSATAVSRNPVSQPVVGVSVTGVRPQLAQHLSTTALSTSIGTSLTTVRSLLDTSKTIDTTSKLQAVPGQAISGSNVIVVSSPTLAGQAAKGVVPKVIDLTSDDESAKGPAASQQSRTMQVVPGTTVSALRPGLVQQQVIRGVNPLTIQQSLPTGTSILLSSPAGLMNTGTTNLTRPGGTFQIVTVASGSNLRPGTLLTVVPAGSPVTTPQNQIRSAIPSVIPTAKPVAQSMPQLRPVTPLNQVTVSTSVRPASTTPTITSKAPPTLQAATTAVSTPSTRATATPPPQKHPAPLPSRPANQVTKGIKGNMPPKPGLKISRVSQGIVLSWNMTVNDNHAEIDSYQLFAYQESSAAPSTGLWKKVGNVKALPLPMACTLTQFQEGNKYHFAVRAVDIHSRIGDFSEPSTIHLTPK